MYVLWPINFFLISQSLLKAIFVCTSLVSFKPSHVNVHGLKVRTNSIACNLGLFCTYDMFHTQALQPFYCGLACCALINKGTNMHRWLNSVFHFTNVAWTPLTNDPCSVSSWERSLMQSCSPAWDSEHYTRARRPPAARRACWETCSHVLSRSHHWHDTFITCLLLLCLCTWPEQCKLAHFPSPLTLAQTVCVCVGVCFC